ncbi:autophagy protein atg9 [Allomyces arbusculus]|nr:autophagy protein atg9 [Allomyces arbusculus]
MDPTMPPPAGPPFRHRDDPRLPSSSSSARAAQPAPPPHAFPTSPTPYGRDPHHDNDHDVAASLPLTRSGLYSDSDYDDDEPPAARPQSRRSRAAGAAHRQQGFRNLANSTLGPDLARAAASSAVGQQQRGRTMPRYHADADTLEDQPLMGSSERRMSELGAAELSVEDDEGDDADDEALQARRRARALRLWLHADNLDQFYIEVYAYFYGKGADCILLNKAALFIRVAIVIGLVIFLSSCLKYSALHHISAPTPIADIIDGDCPNLHPLLKFALLCATGIWGLQFVGLWRQRTSLYQMRDFFAHVLDIPDSDIQTASWPDVLGRLERLAAEHPHPSMTSSTRPSSRAAATATAVVPTTVPAPGCSQIDITARIMRKDNYLIGLFAGEGLLDLRVPLPFIGPALSPCLTTLLEWNIEFCVMGLLFMDRRAWRHGMGRGRAANDRAAAAARAESATKLHQIFVIMAVLNAVFAPVLALFMVAYFFFRYGDEYYRNPGSIGTRRFSPLARWKFRELNEVPHLFERRLVQAHDPTLEYLSQFPSERTSIIARLVSFLLGSVGGVMLVFTVLYPDLLLHLEITPERTPVFWLGLIGSVLAVTRGMRTPDAAAAYDPERRLHEVVAHTHYCPPRWAAKPYAESVRAEVAGLFPPRPALYVNELVGLFVAPLVLGWTLPMRARQVVDFLFDHTVYVPGLGYVYDGATFAPQPQQLVENPAAVSVPDVSVTPAAGSSEFSDDNDLDEQAEMKMTKSILHFKETHPAWQPSAATSQHLRAVMQAHRNLNAQDPTLHLSIYESVVLNRANRSSPRHARGLGGRRAVSQSRVLRAPMTAAETSTAESAAGLHKDLTSTPELYHAPPPPQQEQKVVEKVELPAGNPFEATWPSTTEVPTAASVVQQAQNGFVAPVQPPQTALDRSVFGYTTTTTDPPRATTADSSLPRGPDPIPPPSPPQWTAQPRRSQSVLGPALRAAAVPGPVFSPPPPPPPPIGPAPSSATPSLIGTPPAPTALPPPAHDPPLVFPRLHSRTATPPSLSMSRSTVGFGAPPPAAAVVPPHRLVRTPSSGHSILTAQLAAAGITSPTVVGMSRGRDGARMTASVATTVMTSEMPFHSAVLAPPSPTTATGAVGQQPQEEEQRAAVSPPPVQQQGQADAGASAAMARMLHKFYSED